MANPIVTITMDNGDVMKAELYPEIAPNTVNNFITTLFAVISGGMQKCRLAAVTEDFLQVNIIFCRDKRV